jgi:polysaccharide pyruvyl transferase WcaK-like protein
MWAMLSFIDFDAIWIIRNSRRAQAVEFKSADIIISTGGGFLSTYYMYGLRLYTLSLAFLLKKKVVLLSQSIGPFNTTLSRVLIPLFLNKVSIISVREPSSYRYLKRMKIKTHLYETSDLAFLLPYKIRSVKNRKKIIVCIKNYKGQVRKEYKETIKKITEKLLSQGYKIVILSQTVNDDALGKEIKDSFKNNVDFVEFTPSVYNTMNLYSKCDFVISSRMHGIIFAILSRVPFISIGDEPKFSGLLEQVEYSNKLSINADNIEVKKLLSSVDFLIKNHFQIRKDITNKRTMLIKRAKQNINILEKLI